MGLYLSLGSSFAGSNVVLANGTAVTGYTVRADMNLGSPVEKPMYSRTVDSTGVRVTGSTLDAREAQVFVLVQSTTVAALQVLLDALFAVCQQITQQGGGTLKYRSATGSYVNTFAVASAQVGEAGLLHEYEGFYRQWVTLAMVVDPYGSVGPCDITDAFAVDTFGTAGVFNVGGADWTIGGNTGGAAPSVVGGKLVTSATTGTRDYTHTGTPHKYDDCEVQLKASGQTAYGTNWTIGAHVKYVDANNYVRVYALSSTGTTTGVVAAIATMNGVQTTVVSSAITLPAVGTDFWVVGRIENNTIYIEYWTTQPTPLGTPDVSTSYKMTTLYKDNLGSGVTGRAGLIWNTVGAGTISVDEFKVRACVYRSWTFPDVLPARGAWGGTTDAKAAVSFTSSGGTAPTWMLYAWWPKPPPHNLVWNGGAESIGTSATVAYGWSAAAVAGVSAAATSVTRSTTAGAMRTGLACLELTATVTINSGCVFPIYHRFKKGVRYAMSMWVKSATHTTVMGAVFGASGNYGTIPTVTLSTAYQQITSVWTPTADVEVAYVSLRTQAGAVTVCQFDDVSVFEIGSLASIYSSATDGSPVAEWILGEASGLPQDGIGSNDVSVVNGNPVYGYRGPIAGDDAKCMDFDATGDYLTVPYAAALNPSVFTYEAWAKVDGGAATSRVVLSTVPAAALSGFQMYASSGNVWVAACFDAGGASAVVTSTVASTANQWFHLAATYDGTTLRFYIDGALVGSSVDTYVANASAILAIGGGTSGTSLFNGKIHRARVYNRALTSEEVFRRATGGTPTFDAGGYGPGIINARAYDAAKASVSSDGAWFSVLTADATYRSGYETSSGAAPGLMTTQANLEYFIRPDMFVPDDFTDGEVDIAVFARCEMSHLQTTLGTNAGTSAVNCAISVAPEGGTGYGARRYSEFRSAGKILKAPITSVSFKPYYLGTVTCRVDRSNPLRWKLRLAFTNSGSAAGIFGVDYLLLVPARSVACSRTGAASAVVPSFINTTSQATKVVESDLSAKLFDPTSVVPLSGYDDDGLLRNRLLFDKNGVELLVWPSDQVVDVTDPTAHSMALAWTGTVQIATEPQQHVLRQA